MSEPDGSDVWYLMVHPAATAGLLTFLYSHRMDVVRYPDTEGIGTWGMTPNAAVMQELAAIGSPVTPTDKD